MKFVRNFLNLLNIDKQKYGVCITVDNYVIFFEPSLSVLEIK